MSDYFNNLSNNYIYPDLPACNNKSDNNYLEFLPDGEIGITNGNDILTKLSFDDVKIPVSAWSQKTKILKPGEVTFIEGLTKGLIKGQYKFNIPTLTSSDEDLNPYFMQIDLSINYYSGFSSISKAIEASANYTDGLNIENAINLIFSDNNISVNTTYDPSSFLFKSTIDGYTFSVSNVVLTLIDASQNSYSPFSSLVIDGSRINITYDLEEDVSSYLPSCSYFNSAMKGILLKGIYPTKTLSNQTIESCSKWIYFNHAKNYIDVYEPISINYDSDVSTGLTIVFDSSTYLGSKPTITNDFTIQDISCALYDISIGDITLSDGSFGPISGDVIDGSILDYYSILDSSISNSIITNSYVYQFYINDSSLTGNSINNTLINDSSISDSSIYNSIVSNSFLINTNLQLGKLNDSSTYIGSLKQTDVSYGHLFQIIADGSNNIIYNVFINESSINNYFIYDSSINDSYLYDCSINTTIIYNTIIDNTIVEDVSVSSSDILCSTIYDSSIGNSYLTRTLLNNCFLTDISINDSSLNNVIINNIYISDSSIYNATVDTGFIQNTYLYDVSLNNAYISNNSVFEKTTLYDVSLNNVVLNNDTSLGSNSILENSWVNAYILTVNPSTGEKLYIIEDTSTLNVDSSSYRVNINNIIIWDTSINNATVTDCSIYRSYIQDSSLLGCTIYNCTLDDSIQIDNRSLLIDASILCSYDIIQDTSTFYKKYIKKLDVGRSNDGDDNNISANEYLQWVTDNNEWKKFSELYMWTATDDCVDNDYNLINGFYLYNGQSFDVMVEYLLFL